MTFHFSPSYSERKDDLAHMKRHTMLLLSSFLFSLSCFTETWDIGKWTDCLRPPKLHPFSLLIRRMDSEAPTATANMKLMCQSPQNFKSR